MSTQSRVPVFSSFVAGWVFLIIKFPQLVRRLILPVGVLWLLQVAGWTPQGAIANQSGELAFLITFIIHLAATCFVIAGAYRVAFGEDKRFFLAHLELGPDEVRVLLAKLGIWGVYAVLLIGGALVTQNLFGILQVVGFLLGQAPEEVAEQVIQELSFVVIAFQFGPSLLLSLLMIWFALRFTLVFAGIIAERTFRPFHFMGLMARNTWRMAFLWVLLWLSLIIAMKVPLIVLGAPGFSADQLSDAANAQTQTLLTTFDLGPPLVFDAATTTPPVNDPDSPPVFNPDTSDGPRVWPAWIAPVITVLGNVLWQIVFAGALAHAYRAVTARPDGTRLG